MTHANEQLLRALVDGAPEQDCHAVIIDIKSHTSTNREGNNESSGPLRNAYGR